MLDKKNISKLRKDLLDYDLKRRDVINQSNNALHSAKRSIFAMHRDNIKEAEGKLKDCEKIFKALNTKYKSDPRIKNEGAYKAAVEEYVEATLFHQFLTTGKIGAIKTMDIQPAVFIAGLCDVPGELYRYAIKSATARDLKKVTECATMAQEIIGELIEFNLTSYLRTKFDQAKGAVNRLENVVYEVSLRDK
jgi:translin